jgi:RHS repeat-associated protein
VARSGTPLWSAAYENDDLGLPQRVTYHDGSISEYAHDLKGQLVAETLWNGQQSVISQHTFAYDGAHNRTSGGSFSGYVYDAANRLESATHVQHGATAWTYDFDGNLIEQVDGSGTTTFSYDREGRLSAQSGPTYWATYTYDALGRRIGEVAWGVPHHHLYDGVHVLADYDANGVRERRYTHGRGIDEIVSVRHNNQTYYYIHDQLGSVRALTDASGNVQNQYRYAAWGEVVITVANVSNRFTYTGREVKGDGRTMHYRAREYMPEVGRFAREDPLGFVDGVNVYRYVRNSPCLYIDPYGLSCTEFATHAGFAGMAVGTVIGGVAGGIKGAAAGAGVGTVVLPVVGTVSGATVGAVKGASVGAAAAGGGAGVVAGGLAYAGCQGFRALRALLTAK